MRIQLNSDKTIVVNHALTASVKSAVMRVLGRFETQLTRIEVHLSDLNSHKRGFRDKRCEMEARPAGRRPVSVSDKAPTVMQSVRRAANKMKRLLDSSFGRTSYRTSRNSSNQPKEKKGSAQNAEKFAAKGERLAAASPETKIPTPVRATPRKSAKPRATARVSAKKVSVRQRGPKKKRIYQARRKRWPRR